MHLSLQIVLRYSLGLRRHARNSLGTRPPVGLVH